MQSVFERYCLSACRWETQNEKRLTGDAKQEALCHGDFALSPDGWFVISPVDAHSVGRLEASGMPRLRRCGRSSRAGAVTQFFQRNIFVDFGFAPGLVSFRINLVVRILAVVFVVERYHSPQVLEHAVVHVRAGDGNVAQAGSLEFSGGFLSIDMRVLQQPVIQVFGFLSVDTA